MATHKHHILPRYLGGTNDPSNIIELTVEQHAEAHRELFEKLGNQKDYIAWKALSGQIDTDEIRRLLTIDTWLGRKHTEETKQKIREARSKQKNVRKKGCVFSDTHLKSLAEAGRRKLGTKLPEEWKSKIGDSNRGKKQPKVVCPHCGRLGGAGAMNRWHFDKCKEKK